jgi:DNA-binding response OmpR family regulator
MAKILVVDDEAAISQLLECYLTACGHKVTKSRSSLGSLGWLDAAVFDVVVLDVVMGGPMDGLEVCRTLKSDSRTAGTAVLVISALPYAEEDAYAAGADAFISKPFRLDQIKASVKLLAEAGPTNHPARFGSTVRAAIDAYQANFDAFAAEPSLRGKYDLLRVGTKRHLINVQH